MVLTSGDGVVTSDGEKLILTADLNTHYKQVAVYCLMTEHRSFVSVEYLMLHFTQRSIHFPCPMSHVVSELQFIIQICTLEQVKTQHKLVVM